MEMDAELRLHNYNHGAQKSVAQSRVGKDHVISLGTKLADNERGFVIFLIAPNDDQRKAFESAPPESFEGQEHHLNVGIQTLVDPTFAEIQSCVKTAMVDATHPDDAGVMEDDACDWEALAESWLECENDDIMALAIGPFLSLGFSVFCFGRQE